MKVDIRDESPHVEDQLDLGICYPLSISDTMGILYRRKFWDDADRKKREMVLSPQSLIDAGCGNNPVPFLQEPYGLQTREAYAFTRTKPVPGTDLLLLYKEGEPKYHVTGIKEHFDKSTFKTLLEENFGEGGSKSPMIGSMFLGVNAHRSEFEPKNEKRDVGVDDRDHDVVEDDRDDVVGHYERMLKDDVCHAMVIVGVNTDTEEGKELCVVKNSYGTSWAAVGFGEVYISELYSIEEIFI